MSPGTRRRRRSPQQKLHTEETKTLLWLYLVSWPNAKHKGIEPSNVGLGPRASVLKLW